MDVSELAVAHPKLRSARTEPALARIKFISGKLPSASRSAKRVEASVETNMSAVTETADSAGAKVLFSRVHSAASQLVKCPPLDESVKVNDTLFPRIWP